MRGEESLEKTIDEPNQADKAERTMSDFDKKLINGETHTYFLKQSEYPHGLTREVNGTVEIDRTSDPMRVTAEEPIPDLE